ncbi:hypothetical protein CF327_g781 [Tilletia walkeri]|uniref:GPN-loop GTPase 1 n=1 Tax=Tilletia walkeri TaxID=117179 RepID=A0A8X7NGN9_9BASI|nr:hypothetical protein CF327_g781 [Tilletia walkeri]KAE8272244.1 hypothetical protein A4X09_0g114 [Tilletia walkeri]
MSGDIEMSTAPASSAIDDRSAASVAAAAMASTDEASSQATNAAPSMVGKTSLLPPVPRATSIIIVGMAGSGKSTFAAKLANHVGTSAVAAAAAATAAARNGGEDKGKGKEDETAQRPRPYCVNLDPAVSNLAYEPNVDIRDTVDYAKVMKDYNLGPNGGILTALNLFTTKFDQVLGILEKRATEVDEIILDTPGQIEIFTWSASGSIITDALGSAMPTCVAYVIDTPRTTAPATFMSNMLYACSIMYKSKLPFIIVFNKTDLQPCDFAVEWMTDFEAFQRDLKVGNATDPVPDIAARGKGGSGGARLASSRGALDPEAEGSYMNSLMNSMALVLDEFYSNLRTVGVSSTTGEGIDDFLRAVQEARTEFLTDYRPELERIAAQKEARAEKEKKRHLDRMMRDMALDKKDGSAAGGGRFGNDRWAEEEDDEEVAAAEKGGKGMSMDERRRRFEVLSRRKGKGKSGGAEEDEEDEDELIGPQYEGDGLILDPGSDDDEGERREDNAFERMLGANSEKPYGINFGKQGEPSDGTRWPSAV